MENENHIKKSYNIEISSHENKMSLTFLECSESKLCNYLNVQDLLARTNALSVS